MISEGVALSLTAPNIDYVGYKNPGDPKLGTSSPETADACEPIAPGCIAVIKVHYQWSALTPIIGNIVGPITLNSTAEMPLSGHSRNRERRGDAIHVAYITATARARGDDCPPWRRSHCLLGHGGADRRWRECLGQQRQTQNGTDASAQAGATVLAQKLGNDPTTQGSAAASWDAATSAAVNNIAAANNNDQPIAYYTDICGVLLKLDGSKATGIGDAAQVGSGFQRPPPPLPTVQMASWDRWLASKSTTVRSSAPTLLMP